jgi:hypothetical protein
MSTFFEQLFTEWFNSASLIIAFLSLVIAVISTYIAQRSRFPQRRRLDIKVAQVTKLLRSDAGVGLEVRYGGRTVDQPHLVRFEVSSSGWHSVPSSQFDQGRPIAVSLTAIVVADLTESEQGTATHRLENDRLLIGPDLFTRDQPRHFTLLTSGPPVGVSLDAHLIDTKVRFLVEDTERRSTARIVSIVAAVLTIVSLVGFMSYQLLASLR